MRERRELLGSIVSTIQDYRAGDLQEPTTDHVDRWVRQFGAEVQLPMLRELDHVFRQTYFSRSRVRNFFAGVMNNPDFAGEVPREFWRNAHLFDIQQDGNSQTQIKTAYVPDDVNAPVSDPVAVWREFCAEARIRHDGRMRRPLATQGELW